MVGGSVDLTVRTPSDGITWTAPTWTSYTPWVASVIPSITVGSMATVQALAVGTTVIVATVESTTQQFIVDVVPYTPDWLTITTSGYRSPPTTSTGNPVPVIPESPSVADANCLSSDSVGDLVCITGPILAGLYQTTRVDVSTLSRMPAVGAIVAKTSATDCVIQFWGRIGGVWSGLTPGKTYFADLGGGITPIPPFPDVSNPRIYVQAIGVALDANILMLNPSTNMVIRVL